MLAALAIVNSQVAQSSKRASSLRRLFIEDEAGYEALEKVEGWANKFTAFKGLKAKLRG